MSEKQNFNKGVQNRQIAEKRRERWMSRKILTEILENIRLQRDDANWVLYQVFSKETLSYKSKIKIWNHLMRAGYDLANEKPEKEEQVFSYKEAWQEYKDTSIYAQKFQRTAEENYKLCKQLNKANEQLDKANELLNEIYTHLTLRATVSHFTTHEDAEKWAEILTKLEKRNNEKESKKMDI